MKRRSIGYLVALVALVLAASAQAQDYPNRPVTIITPTGAGSTVDAALRFIGNKIKDKTGQTVLIENKVGAGGGMAAKEALTSRRDGYTFFIGDTSTMSGNRFLYKSLPYDPVKDFVPVQRLFRLAFVLTVNPDKTPVNTVAELTAFLKQKKGPINYGYFTPTMLALSAQYTALAGIDAAQVGYRSSPQMRGELVSGAVDYVFTDAVVATTPQPGMRAIAIASDERSGIIPNLPTMAEAGMKDFRPLFSWFALYAPAGTPEAAMQRMSSLMAEILPQNDTRQFLATFAGEPFLAGPQELFRFQEEFTERWAYLVKLAKIEPQ